MFITVEKNKITKILDLKELQIDPLGHPNLCHSHLFVEVGWFWNEGNPSKEERKQVNDA
jgi:hypothetical protein